MFSYYTELALRSLRRSRGLTVLMVLTIAFGVAASMTTWSVFRAVSGDPIPWKSSKLFVPQIQLWDPARMGKNNNGEPPDGMDYIDAVALMRDHRAVRQSAMYSIEPLVVPGGPGRFPIDTNGHAVYGEFFAMVDAPFEYGGGWSAEDDRKAAAVVVIGSKLNDKVFGGGNSVGKTLNIDDKNYRIVGVLRNWDPQPRFYDIFNTGGFISQAEDLFVPFTRAIAVGMSNAGNTNCMDTPSQPGFAGLQQSDCMWISYMVELDNAPQVRAYRTYLDNYAREQQKSGRYPWAPNNRLRNVPEWLDFEHVVPSDTRVSLLVALGLLIVCLVNTAGLLLAKFLRRSNEIGVRRALGAARRAIYAQFLTEAGIIGVVGGLIGIVLTGIGVLSVGIVLPKRIADLAHFDTALLATTVIVAVVATVVAGLYPTLRASGVQPAWQLKSN